jgi:hypothetical protein
MSEEKESRLKKEFKQSDVARARNLVNKKFTDKTKIQTGYQKVYSKHIEGDTWEESGKTWTVKNGIRQNITKLDYLKKQVRTPLACPKCKGSMKHHLAKKMYKIHGFCFNCVIEYEGTLQKAGLYEAYEKKMMSGNIAAFANDLENWVKETLESKITMVTEQGDVEDWNRTDSNFNDKILKELNSYLKLLRQHT